MNTCNNDKKVLIAMSGGVDSSVAALLAQQLGYDCTGISLRLFINEDIDLARDVCSRLNIRFEVLDFTKDFRSLVIDRFCEAYSTGMTPNPCIDCNRYIKFAKMFDHMRDENFDFLATGHYACIRYDKETKRWQLLRALDRTKDQSYVLYTLEQEQLSKTMFPLGELSKTEVREIAEANGFSNANKKDSQDICFVPDGDYANFIERYTKTKPEPGNFVDIEGNVLGRHEGLTNYTIGQRKGLGQAFGRPVYVTALKPDTNEVVLGDDGDLFVTYVTATNVNLISRESLDTPVRITAKIRYSQAEASAEAVQSPDGKLKVTFDEPQRAPAPGQSVVLYDGDIVVGGGMII